MPSSEDGLQPPSIPRLQTMNTTDDGLGGIMTEVILVSCAFILGGIFGMVLINFMR